MPVKAITPLEARMKLFTKGQITWPEPVLKKHCDACRHYFKGDTDHVDKGRCDLVKCHHRANGKQFVGTEAIACPQFDAGIHYGNDKK